MTPQELWSRIKTSAGNDPRWWTTPAGMVAGVALTRALVPERRRTPGMYAAGAGIGGAVGLGGGTLLQAQGQAPERAALKQHAETLLSQDPKQVSATGGNPAAVANAARKAAVLHYEDKPLEYFNGPLDPREINAAKLALGEQNPYPWAKGSAVGTGGTVLGAAAPGAWNWRNQREGLAAMKKADLEQTVKAYTEAAMRTPATRTPATRTPATAAPGAPKTFSPQTTGAAALTATNQRAWERFKKAVFTKQLIKPSLRAGLLAGGLSGAVPGAYQTFGEGSRKKFDEALGWQMRAAHLESMQRFQQASLDEDQRQALQSALDNARHMADKRRSAANWASWFEIGHQGLNPSSWLKSDIPGR
jgi:hypothetical protein